MTNEWLWILFAILNFIFLITMYRFFGKQALFAWIGMATVLANVQVVKTIELFGVTATLGNIIYGTIFLASDIISEKHGKREAKKAVWLGFWTLLIMTVIMQGAIRFTPGPEDIAQPAIETIFGLIPSIALGSITAYIVSQYLDVWLFAKLKKAFPGERALWIRNNGSTMISQLVDSAIFCGIAFYGVYPADVWIEIFLTTYFIKFLVAAIDTPFLYWAKKFSVSDTKTEG